MDDDDNAIVSQPADDEPQAAPRISPNVLAVLDRLTDERLDLLREAREHLDNIRPALIAFSKRLPADHPLSGHGLSDLDDLQETLDDLAALIERDAP